MKITNQLISEIPQADFRGRLHKPKPTDEEIAREFAKKLHIGPSANSYPKNVMTILAAIKRSKE